MLSIPHLLVIFVVVLVVFGPHKLPELARGLGKLMAEFRKASTDFKMAFEEEMRAIERQARENEFKKAQAAASAVLPAPTTGEAEAEHTIHQPPSVAEGAPTESIEPVVAPVAESVARGDGSAEAGPAAVPGDAQPASEPPAEASATGAESAAATHDSR